MAHKKKFAGHVPPANQSKMGPSAPAAAATKKAAAAHGQAEGPQAQDPKRRLGDFEGAGEHARQQPTRLNDGNQHSR